MLTSPNPKHVNKGQRYQLWVKVGQEMKMISVLTTSDPYETKSADGKRTYMVVDAFGYGWRGTTQVRKLRAKQED